MKTLTSSQRLGIGSGNLVNGKPPVGVRDLGHMSVLTSKVLVLNRSYFPVHVTSVRRAFSLLYQGVVKVVDQQYRTFDYESWSALSADI